MKAILVRCYTSWSICQIRTCVTSLSPASYTNRAHVWGRAVLVKVCEICCALYYQRCTRVRGPGIGSRSISFHIKHRTQSRSSEQSYHAYRHRNLREPPILPRKKENKEREFPARRLSTSVERTSGARADLWLLRASFPRRVDRKKERLFVTECCEEWLSLCWIIWICIIWIKAFNGMRQLIKVYRFTALLAFDALMQFSLLMFRYYKENWSIHKYQLNC